MTITLFHIIIPPVIALISSILIFLLFSRTYRRQSLSDPVDVSCDDIHSTGSALKRRIEKSETMNEQIAEREKMLIKRITANPRDVEAYDLLGQVYLVQGNLNDAAECFQQVVAFDPHNLRAVEQLNKIKKISLGEKDS